MEECPGPESEQEQLACGSSRGEQQFGSVWFHGWKHLQVRNPLFPCLLCETLHCAICDTHACSQTRLGTPCLLWAWLCSMGETVSSVKPFCETFCETWPSVRPWLPWGLAFCETLASVRRCLLWDPSFSETLPLFIMLDPLWDLAFFEALPSVRPCLLWGPAFCGS